jgi:HK97 family phage portal protein
VLAFAYPEPRLRVYRDNGTSLEPLPNHPLSQLLNQPNPQMGQAELLQAIMMFKAISGNAYLYKVRSAARKVVELWPLNDSQIVPVAGKETLISHYEWQDEESGREVKVPAEDIVHFKWLPDPQYPWRGIAPLVAVARDVDTDNEATKYCFALLANDATPRTVMQLPTGAKVQSKDDADRMRYMFMEKYGGANRGTPAIIDNGATISRLSMNMEELAFEALRRVPEARISAAFRVPAVLAGLNVGLENATYANVEGLRRYLTETTLAPLWRLDADEIGSDLLPEFGGNTGLVVAFDTSGVVALQENVKELRAWANEALRAGGITRNQYLGYLGLPPDPAGDVYLMPMTTIAVPAGLPSGSKRLLLPPRTKANADRRTMMLALIAAQRQNRADVAGRMEAALDGWFGGLADKVINRANQQAGKAVKAFIDWEQLLFDSDAAELEALTKRFYVELLQLSWDNWNVELGLDAAFDLADPAVTKALADAGVHVKAIQQTTLDALRDSAQYANEQGWSIDHWVRGDPGAVPPVKGLRDLIEQTYQGRAKTIARTELGNAAQTASANRYAAFGVDRVLVLDNGVEDSAPQCVVLGNGGRGTIMPIAWAQAHPLGHVNCLRAFGAAFPDDGEIDQAALQAWQAAGGDSAAIGGS